MNKVLVTCVIALHREGLLVHTTLCSIARARDVAESAGFSVELVITMDKHDACTEKVVRRHPGIRPDDLVEIVSYGDLGLSRNHGIARASGEYIITMDGDDYYSGNFIAAMVTEAAKGKNSAVYPEYLFSFDGQYGYTKLGGPADPTANSYALFSGHHYCSSVAAHREIFRRIPYAACAKGFGFEGWHWNCEARGAGIMQRIAPGVVLFYRRHSASMAARYAKEAAVIPSSRFFAVLPKPEPASLSRARPVPAPAASWKGTIKSLVLMLLRTLPTPLESVVLQALVNWRNKRKRPSNVFPSAIHKALLGVAAIDGMLHPDHLPPAPFTVPACNEMPGRVYAAAWHSLSRHDYDIIYTVPRIYVGGADLMAANYMRAARDAGKQVLCITTEDSAAKRCRIPEGIDVLHFGEIAAPLWSEEKFRVLTRLLVQLAPAVIHAVNDWFCFELFITYGAALKTQSRLIASIFADAQDEQDIHYGAGTRYLRALFPHCAKILTDNKRTAEEWSVRLGLPMEYFAPVYGVIPLQSQKDSDTRAPRRLLWAGRLDKEKRLDVLLSIANGAPEMLFDVYGRKVLDADPTVKQLEAQPNIRLCGAYDSFFELPVERYFALVYTTQCDGLPNVLLEAVAAGLPVAAPDRGGIRDFITDETGWLISNHTDTQAYINALRQMRDDAPEAAVRLARARALLVKRHNTVAFTRDLFAAYGFDTNPE